MPETTTTTYRPRVGDRVHVDPNGYGVPAATIGRTFVVSKVNRSGVVKRDLAWLTEQLVANA